MRGKAHKLAVDAAFSAGIHAIVITHQLVTVFVSVEYCRRKKVRKT